MKEAVVRKVFLKFRNVHRKTPKLESLFNKVAGLRLQHRCFPLNIVQFLRAAFFYRTPPVAASVMIRKNAWDELSKKLECLGKELLTF